MKNEKIEKSLEEIKNLLRRKDTAPLNFVQAAQYLSISHSQLYKYTSQRKIPFHKPSGKYLYFFKHELDAWIHQNDEPNSIENKEAINIADNQPGLFDEEEETEPP